MSRYFSKFIDILQLIVVYYFCKRVIPLTFSNNIKNLRLNAGLKQKELANLLHVSQQAIAKWETGKSEPNITTLKDIASVFKCSIENLLDNSDDSNLDEISRETVRDCHALSMINFEKMCSDLDENTLDRIHTILYSLRRIQNNSIIHTSDKQLLFSCIAEIIGRIERYVDDFRSATEYSRIFDFSEHNKKFINGEVEVLKEITNIITPQKKPSKERHIVIPFYETPVSAGTGSWLDDAPPAEWITVSRNEMTTAADFMTEVRGDSMQPKFFDGDKVLIKRSDSIYENEIGIFLLNGESFIKKMGRGELISLNSAYQPIKLSEYDDIRCAGKVIGTVNME